MSNFILITLLIMCIVVLTGGAVCIYKALLKLSADISYNLDNIDNTLRDIDAKIN